LFYRTWLDEDYAKGGDHYRMCSTCPEKEVAMATYQCIDCSDYLCADCAAFHSRTKLTKSHEVRSKHGILLGKQDTSFHLLLQPTEDCLLAVNYSTFCLLLSGGTNGRNWKWQTQR